MAEPFPGKTASEKASDGQLNSWKEIAAYLNRDVTTVQRWEKREAMPVHRHLHDKRGSVYALVPELDTWLQSRRLPSGEDPEPKEEAHSQEHEEAKSTPDRRQARAIRSRRWLVPAALAALVLLAVAYVMSRGRAEKAAQPKISSLAVLPLKNLSADPTQEYLSDGMTEALIDQLSRMHDLRVISRTSVMRFKNPRLSVPEIARMLHVDAIVEGSVMRQDDRIRVTAQLIRG
ncbi:MAG: hypothetical protein ABSC93_22675, partial [Bryobacteraceae bacterium]